MEERWTYITLPIGVWRTKQLGSGAVSPVTHQLSSLGKYSGGCSAWRLSLTILEACCFDLPEFGYAKESMPRLLLVAGTGARAFGPISICGDTP